jgi:hypothetical protein
MYANWRAFERGQPSLGAFEYPLYTDAHVTAELREGIGPYQMLNAVPGPGAAREAQVAIIVRVEQHVDYVVYQDAPMDTTDDAIYHGGVLPDEVAALMSLTRGIRLKAGEIAREFTDRDPRGHPRANFYNRVPLLVTQRSVTILPGVTGTRSLTDVGPMRAFSQLAVSDAVSVVRAARLYQDAVWIAEAEPNLAWLMLVSALETGALAWRTAKAPPVDRLRASRPTLFERLTSVGGDDLATFVAGEIADALGNTSNFLRFTLHFLPSPPEKRPGWE